MKRGHKIGARLNDGRNSSDRTDAAIALRKQGHGYRTIATILDYANDRSAAMAISAGIETRIKQQEHREAARKRKALLREVLARCKSNGMFQPDTTEVLK